MKFIVSSQTLLKQLQAVNGVITTNNSLPIVENFLFELERDTLTIRATDLETTMIARLVVSMAEEDGNVAIPAKILTETLKTFADIPITITVDDNTFAIEISAGEGRYKLNGFNGEEFPKVPFIESAATVDMKAPILYNAINKTLFATGNDDMRPTMSGVYCELKPDSVTFVGTDAHKLVRYRRLDAGSDNEANMILPKKPVIQLKNTLSNNEEIIVKIEYNQTNAVFSYGNIILYCRLIEGKYPNYEAVIPPSNPNKLTIDRLSLVNSLKRVSIFSSQSTYQVRFKIAGRELLLNAEDTDFSNEAVERLSCHYEGEDMDIGFNSKFFLEMLNNIDADEIRLEMSAPNRAGIILPATNENKDEEILMLVMPIMLG